MKARWGIAALSLATTLLAAGGSAAGPAAAPQKVALSIPNTQ